MRSSILMVLVLFIAGCTGEQVEEQVFKHFMKSDLIERCGDEKPDCVTAVKSQLGSCMESSNWREILGKEDDDEVVMAFVEKFYPCFKSPDGQSYFAI